MVAEPKFLKRNFPNDWLNHDAVAVVCQLKQAGFEAFFVGGCVRDLLLERAPKDFDIVTDARPEQVKSVFGRQCRLIGRRFRLAHVRMGGSLFEVATFRGPPEEQLSEGDTGFVVRANTYGSMMEDAHSRDFSMNGLFYDPTENVIQDFVGGIEDLARRTVCTIGPADQRFREDPVRILRAVRLATRLSMTLDPELKTAAASRADMLGQCPEARVLEEICRLVESGYAQPGVALMRELDLLGTLLPIADAFVADHESEFLTWLGEIDRLTHANGNLPRSTLFTILVYPAVIKHLVHHKVRDTRRDWGHFISDDMKRWAGHHGIPIRWRQRALATLNILGGQLYKGKRPSPRSLRSPSLPIALSILRIQFRLNQPTSVEGYESLVERCIELGYPEAPFAAELSDRRPSAAPPRKRQRRRRSRRTKSPRNEA